MKPLTFDEYMSKHAPPRTGYKYTIPGSLSAALRPAAPWKVALAVFGRVPVLVTCQHPWPAHVYTPLTVNGRPFHAQTCTACGLLAANLHNAPTSVRQVVA